SALLIVVVVGYQTSQRRPADVELLVPVVRTGVRQPGAALGAQPLAVVPAYGTQRQREHRGVAERRLQVEQEAVEDLVVLSCVLRGVEEQDRKSTRLNSSHVKISYAVFCLKKKK